MSTLAISWRSVPVATGFTDKRWPWRDRSLTQPLLTTEWVLTEVADALAAPSTRTRFAVLINRLRVRNDVRIVSVSPDHFKEACALYMRYTDKEWSLTDCISFLVMRQRGIKTALTADQHFVQAGFQILMSVEPFGIAEPAASYTGTLSATAAGLMSQIRDAA